MPYKDISELPDKIRKHLPIPAQKLFLSVFNKIFKKYGEDKAFKIAWAVVKKRFKKKGTVWVAKTSNFIKTMTYVYYFEPSEMIVTKTDDNYVYLDYVLSDNQPDLVNDKFDDFALKIMANSITPQTPIKGRLDEDHNLIEKLLKNEGLKPSEIENILKQLDTGIEAIYGKYDKGKLIATLKVRKDLLPLIKKYKGASVEVRFPADAYVANTYRQGRLIGFVLTNHPANPRTGYVAM